MDKERTRSSLRRQRTGGSDSQQQQVQQGGSAYIFNRVVFVKHILGFLTSDIRTALQLRAINSTVDDTVVNFCRDTLWEPFIQYCSQTLFITENQEVTRKNSPFSLAKDPPHFFHVASRLVTVMQNPAMNDSVCYVLGILCNPPLQTSRDSAEATTPTIKFDIDWRLPFQASPTSLRSPVEAAIFGCNFLLLKRLVVEFGAEIATRLVRIDNFNPKLIHLAIAQRLFVGGDYGNKATSRDGVSDEELRALTETPGLLSVAKKKNNNDEDDDSLLDPDLLAARIEVGTAQATHHLIEQHLPLVDLARRVLTLAPGFLSLKYASTTEEDSVSDIEKRTTAKQWRTLLRHPYRPPLSFAIRTACDSYYARSGDITSAPWRLALLLKEFGAASDPAKIDQTLSLMISERRIELLPLLVNTFDANVNCVCSAGLRGPCNALVLAAQENERQYMRSPPTKFDMLRCLLDLGAKFSNISNELVNMTNGVFVSPVREALKAGEKELAERLVEVGFPAVTL